MIILSLILIVSAFLIGFLLGVKGPRARSVLKPKRPNNEFETLMKEYENFLNYDGTEQ